MPRKSPLFFFIVFYLCCRHVCGGYLNSMLCLYIKNKKIWWTSSQEGFYLYFLCSLAAGWLVAGFSETGGLLTAAASLYCIPVEQILAGDQNATWSLFMLGWQHPFPAGSLYEWWIKLCGRCWLYCISGSQALPSFSLLFTDECCWISAFGSVREAENVPGIENSLAAWPWTDIRGGLPCTSWRFNYLLLHQAWIIVQKQQLIKTTFSSRPVQQLKLAILSCFSLIQRKSLSIFDWLD